MADQKISQLTDAGAPQDTDQLVVARSGSTLSLLFSSVKTALNALYVPLARTITAGTGLSGGGDLSADRTLSVSFGTSSATACVGNDSRLSDSRTPSGSAGGDLTGTYPNPTIGSGKVTEGKIGLSDVTTDNVTSSAHGFAPKSPADATKFLNGAATPAFAQVKDSDLSTSDVTTNDVSASKHGFAPKAPNDATKYLDGTGAYSVPAKGLSVLFDSTLGADTASIDTGANGIASGHTALDIWIVVQLSDAAASASLNVTVNNDTGSNYDTQFVFSQSTTTSAGVSNAAAQWQFGCHGSGGSSSYASVIRIWIPQYDQTTFWKSAIASNNRPDATAGNEVIQSNSLGYRSTTAISRMKIAGATGNLKAGSRLLIMGVS